MICRSFEFHELMTERDSRPPQRHQTTVIDSEVLIERLQYTHLSVCLSVTQRDRQADREVDICLSLCPSLYLSVYPSVCLSVRPCLSVTCFEIRGTSTRTLPTGLLQRDINCNS